MSDTPAEYYDHKDKCARLIADAMDAIYKLKNEDPSMKLSYESCLKFLNDQLERFLYTGD